uniref:Uncharacterized protein n=1 Tax=Amphimedon queenslandica TaxID=400682 RepID=A0A1X7UIZ2_AMPQE
MPLWAHNKVMSDRTYISGAAKRKLQKQEIEKDCKRKRTPEKLIYTTLSKSYTVIDSNKHSTTNSDSDCDLSPNESSENEILDDDTDDDAMNKSDTVSIAGVPNNAAT